MDAVIYARYSSDGQRAASLEDQERNCRRRADAEGWHVVRVYADAAISGATTQRPQYQEMLSSAARSEFAIILVDDLSRLTRDSVEQERTIRRLEFQGARIIATSDGYDSASTSAARRVHRGVKGLMNELYLEDLAAKVHRGQTGQALKGRWNGGRPYGYRLVAIRDPSQRDAYGEALQIGTRLEIDPEQSPIVRDIFERYANGASCLTIARELNARGIPSPGSTWRRKTRRSSGWMESGIRVILRNELYTGKQVWNRSRFVRNPDSGKHLRRTRDRSDWIEHELPELRIVSSELFRRAQRRGQPALPGDPRLKSGGRAKYLLSGLLVCQKCGAHYVLANERAYGCSSHARGGACDNGIRIRRDSAEAQLLGPVRDELLSPESVTEMAKDLQVAYSAHAAQQAQKAAQQPREIQALEERIERLHGRKAAGDPDMPADELQAAIERAQEKLDALQRATPEGRGIARIATLLPRAAAEIRTEIDLAMKGKSASTERARMLMRRLFGRIKLEPAEEGGLWANMDLQPAALLRTGGGTIGRGERI